MKWYDLTCPWCGVALRSPDVRVGMTLGCPNQRGGCGRPSKIKADLLLPMQLRIANIKEM